MTALLCTAAQHRWAIPTGHYIPDVGAACLCGKTTWRAVDTAALAVKRTDAGPTVVYIMVDGQIVAAAASPPTP